MLSCAGKACLCCAQLMGCVQLFATLRSVAHQAPLCPRNFPGKNTVVGYHSLLRGSSQVREERVSLVSPALAGGFFATTATWGAPYLCCCCCCC